MRPSLAGRDMAVYTDLSYRDVFWPARRYEDECDRIALRALLPARGRRLIEVGAGFGRLGREYSGFREVVLLDSSPVHVAAARQDFAGDPRVRPMVGDAFALPFADAYFDVVVCVRVFHHFEDPLPALREFARVLRPGGTLVLEFANKRNLKSIFRYWARRQSWSPFSLEPHSYLPVHFDHSPVAIRKRLRVAGFQVEATRTASVFRVPAVTRRLPIAVLAALESRLQRPLGLVTAGPSVFVRATRLPRAMLVEHPVQLPVERERTEVRDAASVT